MSDSDPINGENGSKQRTPYFQRCLKSLLFFTTSFVLIGSLLDALANSSSFVTNRIGIVLTSIVICLWVGCGVWAKLSGIPWRYGDHTVKHRSLKLGENLLFIGALAAIWSGRIIVYLDNIDRTTQKSEPIIMTSYARLYGGFHIPLILDYNLAPARIRDNTFFAKGDRLQHLTGINTVGPFTIQEALKQWRSGQFGKAKIITEPLWNEFRPHYDSLLSENRIDPYRTELWQILFREKSGIALHEYDIAREIHMNSTFPVWDYDTVEGRRYASRIVKEIEEFEENNKEYRYKFFDRLNAIGFLFLIVEGSPEVRPSDLIFFRFKMIENDIQKKISIPADVIERKMTSMPIRGLFLTDIHPGDLLMIPIAVYNKDANGYPEVYLSSVIKPVAIEWERDGVVSVSRIREPLKETAAKILLPFGWYGQ